MLDIVLNKKLSNKPNPKKNTESILPVISSIADIATFLPRKNLKHMSKANARRNLFTMLIFEIKGFIDADSIKRNALTRVDVTIYGRITPLTGKNEIEDHLLQRNPWSYWDAGSTLFGHTPLWLSLGPTGDPPLANSILDGTFTHPNLTIKAFTSKLRR
jgi:hypothetical protein